MCGGGGTTYNPPQQLSLSESLKSAMDAQGNPELNRKLFEAESNQEYGRPAYARLEQQIINEALYGKRHTVDENGNIEKLVGSSVSPDAEHFVTNREDVVQTMFDRYGFDKNGKGTLDADMVLSKRYLDYDNDTAYLAFIKKAEDYFQKYEYDFPIEVPTKGEAFDKNFNKLDRELEFETEFVGLDKAGQEHYEGGGLVETIAGSQEHTFTNADGTETTRRIGFDENGQPMGVSGVARDLEQVDKAQRFASEIQFMKEYGDEFTEQFRQQGDIQGALDQVERLAKIESAPRTGVDARGSIMTDLTDRINRTASRITSPYGTSALETRPEGVPTPAQEFRETFNRGRISDLNTQITSSQDRLDSLQELNQLSQNQSALENAMVSAQRNRRFDDLEDLQRRSTENKVKMESMQDAMGADYDVVFSEEGADELIAGLQSDINRASDELGSLTETGSSATSQGDMQSRGAPQMSASRTGDKLTDERGVDRVTYRRANRQISEDADFGDISPTDADFQMQQDSSIGDLGGLRSSLLGQAISDLEAGGDLSERDIRNAQQSARIASVARGRTRDSASILAELENNERLRSARRQERRAFATDIAGREGTFATTEAQLGLSGDQIRANIAVSDANRQLQGQTAQAGINQAEFGAMQAGEMFNVNNESRQSGVALQADLANQAGQLQLTGMDQSAQMFEAQQEARRDATLLSSAGADVGRQMQVDQYNRGVEMSGLAQDRAFAMQRVGIETGTASDPLMLVSGRPSGAGVMNAGAMYAGGAQTNQLPQMFNPMTGVQFFADQQSNLNDYNIAYGNQQAQISAGRSAMVGNILGGITGMFNFGGGGRSNQGTPY